MLLFITILFDRFHIDIFHHKLAVIIFIPISRFPHVVAVETRFVLKQL